MAQLEGCYSDFLRLGKNNNDNLLTSPARVLGIVYGDVFETHWDNLTFFLLDGFCKEFKDTKRSNPDRIIVLLTDQEAIFESGDRDWDRLYWQDTCALEPILKCYFGKAFGEQF